jgi:ABC-type taurine transport system ATPase subunit
MNRKVLQVEQACRHFLVQRGWLSAPQKVEALIDANLTMFEGECLGVIGESGSGENDSRAADCRRAPGFIRDGQGTGSSFRSRSPGGRSGSGTDGSPVRQG